jgi:hypothetical protein
MLDVICQRLVFPVSPSSLHEVSICFPHDVRLLTLAVPIAVLILSRHDREEFRTADEGL